MPRGKGTLEIKPSTNPYFQTSSSNVGRKVEEVKWQAPEVWRPKVKADNDGFFPFMFEKPTNNYGTGVQLSDSAISSSMRNNESPGDVATKIGEGLYVAAAPPPYEKPPIKASLDEVLESYNHRSKPENPVYTTSSNSIGFKRPDKASYSIDRVSVPQAFSNSFGGINNRDQGLNTALSRSVIHDKLDPQFL